MGAIAVRGGVSGLRAASASAVVTVRYSKLDHPYEVNSWWEGHFIERIAPGSARHGGPSSVKVLFNHGFDSALGGKTLGVPTEVGERDGYAYLEVPFLDVAYANDILAGVRAGAYGSSFAFTVLEDSWNHKPEASESNPNALPERTILSYELHEAGPVTWPANPEADAQTNSGTDWYYSPERAGAPSDSIRGALRIPQPPQARSGMTSRARRRALGLEGMR